MRVGAQIQALRSVWSGEARREVAQNSHRDGLLVAPLSGREQDMCGLRGSNLRGSFVASSRADAFDNAAEKSPRFVPLQGTSATTRRRGSRKLSVDLAPELNQLRDELTQTLKDLAAANFQTSEANARTSEANARTSEANARTILAKDEVVAAQRDLAKSVKGQAEAELMSLDRIRELGLVHARGIIEWAESRARRIDPARVGMSRFELWADIIKKNPHLRDCLTTAGWPPQTLTSNMLGLYASLSTDIHRDATPRVSNTIGGIVISLNDSGAGVNATNGKVLLCLARSNYIRASLSGADGEVIESSPGLSKKKQAKAYAREERAFSREQRRTADKPMV